MSRKSEVELLCAVAEAAAEAARDQWPASKTLRVSIARTLLEAYAIYHPEASLEMLGLLDELVAGDTGVDDLQLAASDGRRMLIGNFLRKALCSPQAVPVMFSDRNTRRFEWLEAPNKWMPADEWRLRSV